MFRKFGILTANHFVIYKKKKKKRQINPFHFIESANHLVIYKKRDK